jgi:hypothetical protein
MNEQLLKDFIATAQKYNYNWNKAFGLFPELKGYDQQVLKDYVATAEKYNYDYGVVNSKFPELGFGEPSKKKELTASASNLEKPTSASSSKRRFEGVTEEPVSQKKVRTDDYIDQVQNAKTQPKQTKTVVANTFVPNVTEQNVDVITTDEANKMMAEDFGKKEFELYSNISDIDPNVLGEGKASAVDYLNNKFKGSGFVFEKGVVGESGNSIIIKSTLNDGFGTVVNEKIVELPTERVLSIGGFDEEGAKNAQKEIADFMNQAFLKKSEKEFLNKEVTDYGQLVKLAVNNPQKYGEEFLNQYDSERWLDEQYRDLVIEGKSIQREKQNLQSEIDAYKKSGVFNAETERLISSRQANLQNQIEANATKYTDLKDISTKLPKAAAVYFQKKEKEGNLAGLIGRQAIGGFTGIPKMIATTGVDIAPALIPSKYLIPEVQQVRLKASGMSEADIRDYAAKQVRQGVLEEGLQATKDIFSLGTTEEYVQSQDRGDLEKVASFLAESIGTAVSGGGNPLLTKLAFFSQSYNAIEDEMNSPEFDGMSQMEKKIMSVPYGLVIGALDRLGFNVATKIGSNPVVNKLITNTIANAFTSIPKNASIEVMEQAIKESLTATIAKTGLQIAGGSLVEGTTEGVQSLAEYGMKNLYNNFVADKEVFQDVPDITTKEGFDKALSAAKEEFYYGALGGAIMSTGGVALESIAKGFNKGADEFDFFSKVIDDPNLRALIQTDIKTKITSGEITKAQAAEQIDAINKSVSILNQMPTDMSSDKKMEAYNLILEKNKIDKEIDGKDPNLVKPQTERVGEINNRLQQIAQENAVQKQSADEVPVQSGAGVGQEVAGGTPGTELKETAQKGQEEVIKVGSTIKWDVFGNEEQADWNVVSETETRKGEPAVELSKVYVESSSDGTKYTKEYADENGIKYENEYIETHIVPLSELNVAQEAKESSNDFKMSDAQKESYDKLSSEEKASIDELINDENFERSIGAVDISNESELEDQINKSAISFDDMVNKALNVSNPKIKVSDTNEKFTFGKDTYNIDKANEIISNESLKAIDVPVDVLPKMSYSFISVDDNTVKKADLSKPVIIANTKDGLLLIDGHHRVRKAINENKPIKAFVLNENQTAQITGQPTAQLEESVVAEAVATPEIDPNEKFTFTEDKVPAALKGVEPIGRTEVRKKGLPFSISINKDRKKGLPLRAAMRQDVLYIKKNKPTVTLTYSGQQLIDAGINQSTIQNEEFTKTSERTEAQARPENDGRADQAVRENAKRENVKTSIQRLRDQGLLVTAKEKGGKMTDAEINAFMSLSDAMAKVWKQTTGQDNFYDTFIDQVKQGDLNAIKEKGGVLFQNIEVPQRPVSRVTLAAFETPAFKQMRGKEVSIDQVRNLTKSLNKPIEKDIINEVLSYEKYQGKKMSFDEFRNDVEVQLMKLEPLVTNRWKNYGKDQLGDNHDYGEGESVILNAPIDHGYTHPIHWEESDFSYGNLKSTTRWETRQLPGTNQYVAIDSDIPAGLVGEEIVEYIGMSGDKDQVDEWVKLRSKGPAQWDEEVNIGMFGHFRNWFNKGSKIFTIAELQSDWFRYKKSDDIFKDQIDKGKVNNEALQNVDEISGRLSNRLSQLNKSISEQYGLTITADKNYKEDGWGITHALPSIEYKVVIKDSNGKILESKSSIGPKASENSQSYLQENMISNSLLNSLDKIWSEGDTKQLIKIAKGGKITEQQLKDIDTILNFDAETNYFSSDEKGRILSDLERNQFRWEEVMNNARNIREFEEAQKEVDDLRNTLELLRPNSTLIKDLVNLSLRDIASDIDFLRDMKRASEGEHRVELEKQKKIAEDKAIDELKNSKEGNLILKQFLASAKVYETRLLREAIKYAAKKGATELWFPTPFTESSLQGHINKTRNGNTPYQIIYQVRQDELNVLDEIELNGDKLIVLESDPTTVKVANKYDVEIYNRVQDINDDAETFFGFELKKDFDSQFPLGITRQQVESLAYQRNLQYDYIVQEEMEVFFEINPDTNVLFWDYISDDVINRIEQDLDSQSNEDLFGYGYDYYQFGSRVYQVKTRDVFDVYQPKEYSKGKKEYEGWENNLQKPEFIGVVNKYKDLNKLLTKIRPDAKIEVDNNGFEWISTKITAEDLMNPVIAFQNEGAKVKGAVDFSNDNKASIYLFDGADISTLAHEVSGHVGRRMLAKLAETDKGFRKDYEAAMKWAGAKDGEWSVAAEEKFARGFERYLQTGKAPFEELRTVFERLRTWLTNIYKQIRGSSIDVKLTPEITRVFDNLLRVKTKEKPMADNKMKSVMAIVKQGKEQGKTDEEIRKDAMDAGFGAKEAANALAMYYAQGEGIFTRSGKTGVTTKLVEGAKKLAQQYATSKGLMPKIGFSLKERMEGEISKEANRAVKTSRKFGKLFDKTKEDKELLLKDFDNYIRGDKSVQLPNEFIGVANEMRNHIDTLSEMLINNGAVTGEMAETIIDNLGSYLSRSYEIYDNKNYRNKVGDELVNQARNFLRTQPGTILEAKAEAIKKGIPLAQAIESMLDNKIGDLFADVKLEGFFKGAKVGAKDLSTLKFRQDIPEQIRMLMGEYTDPAMNYARTVNKLIHLAAQHKFLSDIREAGFGKFFFEKGDALRPAGYNSQIAAEGSNVMAPLNGLYTTPEIFEAFQKQFNPKEIGAVMKFFYRVMSLTKWLKTIASLGTHAKNIFGNTAFVMSNGHDITKLGSAIKIVANDLKTMSKPEIQAKIDEYIEAGIMRQGAGINEIRDMFKDASLDDYLERRLSAKQPRTLFGKAGKFLSSFGKKIVTGLEDAYQAEDDMFKIAAYENEMSRYADALYNKQVKNLTPEQKAEVSKVAAENVKNTYPTYSRIPEGIKLMRKVPLFIGSFISFQAESYRTAFNTIALAKEELSSDNKKLKKIGATRVAGSVAYLTVKNAWLSYAGMAFGTGLSGIVGALYDDEEEEKKEKDVREFLPEWSKNSDLIITKKADGTIEYIDFSASDAHGGLNKVLNAFFRGDDLLDSFSKSLLAIIEPFVGPDITVGLAIQLYNNENDFGGKVYNEQDTFAEKTRKITDYVYKVIEPGTLTSARKLMKEEDTKNVVRGELTGMKTRPLEVKKQFEFKVADYTEELAEIKRIYNSEYNKTVRMMGDPKATKKDIEDQKKITDEAFSRANSQYDAKTKQLMELVNAANRLGVEYDELIQIIKAKKAINQYNLFEIQQGRPAIIEEKRY